MRKDKRGWDMKVSSSELPDQLMYWHSREGDSVLLLEQLNEFYSISVKFMF